MLLGIDVVVVVQIEHQRNADLTSVGKAHGLLGGGLRLRKDRKQNGGKDRDDRDDDEKFDKRKALWGHGSSWDRLGRLQTATRGATSGAERGGLTLWEGEGAAGRHWSD